MSTALRSSLSQRIVPILGLMVGAPVCAEYLPAYLPDPGDFLVLAAGLLVLGPFTAGRPMLIRETAVRTGRGWPGVVLLAAGFGLLMTSQVDGSMWLVHDPEIAYWDELRAGTLVASLGFAVFPVFSWVVGHVMFSVGGPLPVLEALAPAAPWRPLFGGVGLFVVALLCVSAGLLIRNDPEYAASDPSALQTWTSLLAAVALIGLAFSPVGRPVVKGSSTQTMWTPVRTLVTGGVALVALDLLPATWVGVGLGVVVLTVGGWWVVHASRSPSWGLAQVSALGVAAVIERTVVGFIAPLPPGVGVTEKMVQSAVLLGLASAVAVAAWRRGVATTDQSPAPGSAA